MAAGGGRWVEEEEDGGEGKKGEGGEEEEEEEEKGEQGQGRDSNLNPNISVAHFYFAEIVNHFVVTFYSFGICGFCKF